MIDDLQWQDGVCPQCGGEHHEWELADMVIAGIRSKTGFAHTEVDAVLTDCLTHVLVDPYERLVAAGVPEAEVREWMLSPTGPGAAVGMLLAVAEQRGVLKQRSLEAMP